MPRRHKSTKHAPFRLINNETNKVRYPSERAAKDAAELRMLEYPNLELSVYQGPDGGWYLTRKSN